MRTNAFSWRPLANGVLIALLFALPALAGPFSRLIVFGDSLSDVGNIDQVSPSFFKFPGPYYYDGRFSNGPVYVEALATGLGLPAITHSAAGGNNFAYGGAQTTGTGGFEGLFIRDIDEQVTQFLSSRPVDPAALYLVFAGSNDLVGGDFEVGDEPVEQLASDLSRLIAAGARQFLIPNLPPLGSTPRFNADPMGADDVNNLSAAFNTALASLLDGFEDANASLEFYRLDVDDLFQDALADPGAFGLTNTTDAAAPGLSPGTSSYNTNLIAAEPNEYLFWDDLHPTAAVHAILAERALSLLFTRNGDFNGNGIVDAADYTFWRNSLGESGSNLSADGNGDGMITPLDYQVWKANYGEVLGAGANMLELPFAAVANREVPEPASALLALLAIATVRLFVRVTPTHTPRLAEFRCQSCG